MRRKAPPGIDQDFVLLFAITTCGLGLERFVHLEPARRKNIIRLRKAIRRGR